MKRKNSFTLIEILVVTTIISLLMAGGVASYSQFGKQSRDARRKTDLEQIRAALEMYRSGNTYSSYPTQLSSLVPNYIKSIPIDPKTQVAYTYSQLPAGCNGTTTPCSNYSLETSLEASGSLYQTDPYGGSTLTNTPAAQPTSTTAPTTPTPTTGFSEILTPTSTPTPTPEKVNPTNTPTPKITDPVIEPTPTDIMM